MREMQREKVAGRRGPSARGWRDAMRLLQPPQESGVNVPLFLFLFSPSSCSYPSS